MFDVNSFEFDTPLDVIVCMNNDFILQNFAINLIDVNEKVYKKSEGKVTGILLEKSKKKYYNIDIIIVVKALIVTFEEMLKDKNKLAKISLMFMEDGVNRFRNLRLLVDFFSYKELCPNSDSTYLYLPGLYFQENINEYLLLNSIGFDAKKVIELILDRELLNKLNSVSSMGDNKINLISYGNRLKTVIAKKGIDENTIPKVESVVYSI